MMPPENQPSGEVPADSTLSSMDPRVVALLKEYQTAREKGLPTSRQELLGRHPELADTLDELLDALDLVHAAGMPSPGPELAKAHALGSSLGSLEIVRELGRGGMGVVYEAVEGPLGRHVALKILPTHLTSSPALRERFLREAQATSQLHHTNIVPVFAFGERDGVLYYTMQLIHGQSLDGMLRARREQGSLGFDPRWIARVGMQVAGALDHAHRQNIIHRDIKPGNLLVDRQDNVWVTDFGLAYIEGAEVLSHTGDVVGTLRFMAPERFRGITDYRSDVYSLGVTLYELATLHPPFLADDRLQLLQKVEEQTPPRPRQMRAGLPRDLETIILKAMEKDPGQRYQSAEALAEDLRCFLEDRPIRARPLGAAARLVRWCRRKPALATVTGLALAAVLVTLATLLSAVLLISSSLEQETQARQQAHQQAEENDRLAKKEAALRRQLQQSEAGLLFNEAQRRCINGEPTALLKLAQALDRAGQCGSTDLETTIRLRLAAWSHTVPTLQARFQTPGPTRVAAAHPDTSALVTAGGGTDLYRWCLKTGRRLEPPLAHSSSVLCAAFSPDGGRLAVATQDGPVYLWRPGSQPELLHQLPHQQPVGALAFSPDGELLVTGSREGALRCWEVADGRPRGADLSLPGSVTTVAVASSPLRAFAGLSPSRIYRCDLETGKQHPLPAAGNESIEVMAAGRENILLVGTDSGFGAIQDQQTGALKGNRLEHEQAIRVALFHPSQPVLLMGGDAGTVCFWDVRTHQRIGFPLFHEAAVAAAAISSGGSELVTVSRNGSVRTWKVDPGRYSPAAAAHEAPIVSMAYSRDGTVLMTADESRVFRLWDAATLQPRTEPIRYHEPLRHPSLIGVVALHPSGTVVATPGKNELGLALWRDLPRQPSSSHVWFPGRITALQWHPNEPICAAACGSGVQLWNVTRMKQTRAVFFSPGRTLFQMAISPDGRSVVTIASYREATAWSWASGEPLGPSWMIPGDVRSLTFHPDGRSILTGARERVSRWILPDGRPASPPVKLPGTIHSVAYDPRGQIFAAGSHNGLVYLCQDSTGQLVGPPLHHGELVHAVAFHPSGRRLAAAGRNNHVYQWQLPRPLKGDAARVVLWSQVTTGARLDQKDTVEVLSSEAWHELQERLTALGGPP